MVRPIALTTAIAVSLLAVSGAGGAQAQTPKRGGTVVYVAGSEPACLNVFIGKCAVIAGWSVPELVLKGAFSFAPGNSLRRQLVSNVEYTTKPPFTLTYHIRPDAHWSDGVQISAQDFVFTHQAFRKYPENDYDADLHLTTVRSVRALNAKTVGVVLRTRFAGWRTLFRGVLPRHALAGVDLTSIWSDRIDNPKTGEPIGSGPFLVEDWERGKQLTLVRNARYWGQRPAYLDRIVLRSLSPAEDLRKGEFDILWAPVSPQQDFPRLPGFGRGLRPGVAFQHLEIRVGPGGHPALRGKPGKLVRRALAYGINRVGIVRALFGEIDPKPLPLDSNVFLAQSDFYEPNWRIYRYRPEEARRLLEQSGCRQGADGIYVCKGQKLSLVLFTTAGNVGRERIAQLVQAQLRRVGIEVIPKYAPAVILFDQILPSGKWDLALFGYAYGPDPYGRDEFFGCGGSDNWTGYCQRLVTRDLDQADRILDEVQQARVLNRADAQMVRDVPVIPLLQGRLAVYRRSNIRNFVMSFPGDYWKAENWWLER
jgi:peptide/nickel transport system substrate-binding protein